VIRNALSRSWWLLTSGSGSSNSTTTTTTIVELTMNTTVEALMQFQQNYLLSFSKPTSSTTTSY
jgi:hypothetical protein